MKLDELRTIASQEDWKKVSSFQKAAMIYNVFNANNELTQKEVAKAIKIPQPTVSALHRAFKFSSEKLKEAWQGGLSESHVLTLIKLSPDLQEKALEELRANLHVNTPSHLSKKAMARLYTLVCGKATDVTSPYVLGVIDMLGVAVGQKAITELDPSWDAFAKEIMHGGGDLELNQDD
jgi:hypothetical protein